MSNTIMEVLKSFAKAAGFEPEPKNIVDIIANIIGSLLSLLGVIFLCLIIYGGFVWMTATGNETKVAKAKQIIINATIGLLIVLSSYSIASFVLGALGRATN